MGKIIELNDHIANMIAAGEVVERPLNVVKELVENSIDANSTYIVINLLDSGMRKIEVIDNGDGMDEEDALKAFKRHATSKLQTEHDLYRISTLGFRGEAIPSIASVSEFILKTKKKLNGILAEKSGQDIQTIEKDTDRDNFMSANEALKYGLIDKIFDKR